MEQRAFWLVVCAFTVLGTACGDDDGGSAGIDGGGSVGIDAGPIAMVDAWVPPGTDGGTPVDTDSGTAPDVDSGTTPGTDSGTGGGGDRDPRLESDPDPGQVTCGSATCNVPSQTCCTMLFPQGQSCTTSCSGGTSARGDCDGPEDCSGGEICCAPSGLTDLAMGTTCESSCGTRFQMCQTDSDCPGGQSCHTCEPPMGMGNVVGLCNASDRCPGNYTTL